MVKSILGAAFAVVGGMTLASSAQAVDLPSDTVDRAVVCTVYGGFAPAADPRTAVARRNIDQTVEGALASGVRTREQVKNKMYDVIQLAMYEEPRAELIANWNECRDSFAR